MNKILELTKKLIQFQTTSDNLDEHRRIIDFVKEELKDFTIIEFEKNGILSLLIHNQDPKFLPANAGDIRNSEPRAQFNIILNGHLDVVHADETQFSPVEKDGKLFGRGSYDMKSGCAIIIELFKNIAHEVNYPLALQLVMDEEAGGFTGTLHQLEQGVRSDFVIGTEPTDYLIKTKAKGILWIKIHAKGESAHGAYPWKGKNSIQLLRETMNNIEAIFPTPQKDEWVTTCNPTQISTDNKSSNSTPNNAFVGYDIRFVPEDEATIIDRIKSTLPENCKLEVVFHEPVHNADDNNNYVRKLVEIVKEETEIVDPIIKSNGASDLRHYQKFGIAGVEFGPKGAGHHSEEEWVDVESLERTYVILNEFLRII
jgi:succinyl-diaminopimelate desuccinylase